MHIQTTMCNKEKIHTHRLVCGDRSCMNKTKNVFSFLLQAVRLKCAGPHSSTELHIRLGDQSVHRGGLQENGFLW